MRVSPLVVLVASALLATAFPASAAHPEPGPAAGKKLRVVVFGAHPDDPESGCGGLIALLRKAGHEVVVGYATCYRGDRMHRRRGTEAGVGYAEAYLRADGAKDRPKLPMEFLGGKK